MASMANLVYGSGGLSLEKLDIAKQYAEILKQNNVTEIDTARIYGESEAVIGKLGWPATFTINTKAPGFAPGSLSTDSILKGQQESFKQLQVDHVNIYFLHAPDPSVPLPETLSAINELHRANKFSEFGLSNYSAAAVQEVYDIAKANGYVLPTVYQGNYNPVARRMETEVFPVLRRLGIRYHAYSAIAGGFLSKSVDTIVQGGQGRWDPASRLGGIYHKLYNRPKMMEGLRMWGEAAKEGGMSGTELAYRYMGYHSFLKKEHGDAIILGASKPAQLAETLEGLKKGPLPKELVDRVEQVWETVKGDASLHNTDVL